MTNQSPQFVDPNLLYTIAGLADVFRVDEKWIKKHLVHSKACRFKKQGNLYLILGKWVIEWAESH